MSIRRYQRSTYRNTYQQSALFDQKKVVVGVLRGVVWIQSSRARIFPACCSPVRSRTRCIGRAHCLPLCPCRAGMALRQTARMLAQVDPLLLRVLRCPLTKEPLR